MLSFKFILEKKSNIAKFTQNIFKKKKTNKKLKNVKMLNLNNKKKIK